MQAGINALLQEDVAAEVLLHFSTREKLQLASVCRVWRACVAKSWSSVELAGPNVQTQLDWLARHIPPRMPKVNSSLQCLGDRGAQRLSCRVCLMGTSCLQLLAVGGGTAGGHALLDVAPSVQPFTALRCLCLTPIGGVTPACVAALSTLQHLASLVTDLSVSSNTGVPLDLAAYARFTGALPGPPHTHSSHTKAVHCCRTHQAGPYGCRAPGAHHQHDRRQCGCRPVNQMGRP